MMIVMSDACTTMFSGSVIDNSGSIIDDSRSVIDDSTVMLQLVASVLFVTYNQHIL
jgi:hypothetical protein